MVTNANVAIVSGMGFPAFFLLDILPPPPRGGCGAGSGGHCARGGRSLPMHVATPGRMARNGAVEVVRQR